MSDLSKEDLRKYLIKHYLNFKKTAQEKLKKTHGIEKAEEMVAGFKCFSDIWIKPYGLIDVLSLTIEKKSIPIKKTNDFHLIDWIEIDIILIEEGLIGYESFGRLLRIARGFRSITEQLTENLNKYLNLNIIKDKKIIQSGKFTFNIVGKDFDTSSDFLFLYDYLSKKELKGAGLCIEKSSARCFKYAYNAEFDRIDLISMGRNSILKGETDFKNFSASLSETLFDYKNNQKDVLALNKYFGIKDK